MSEGKLWSVKKKDWAAIRKLVRDLGVSALTAHLLVNRGIKTGAEAQVFFEASTEHLTSLEQMPGCAEAAAIIAETIGLGEKIVVFGDYDADGVTATAILVKGLARSGAEIDYRIPDRFSEGYDLNETFVDWAVENGYSLIITVDCGIKAFECIDKARKKGLKVIVTDHHEPGDMVPEADVVINPKLHNDSFTRELAGAGVALALVRAFLCQQGLKPDAESGFQELLELAAIGTIADSVSLLDCNRIIAKHGLQRLGETDNIGLAALFEVEGLKDKSEFGVTDISFKIGPCINAVGRIGDANEAVALLVADSSQVAWELAQKLHRDNSSRQILDRIAYLEAVEKVEQEIDLEQDPVIVLASENWHPGVIGISAARVVQRFNRPAVLISIEDGVGKGSARSPRGFDIHAAFNYCSSVLLKYGGHKNAGGFTISADNIEEFRKLMNEYAQTGCTDTGECLEEAEGEVFLQDLDFKFMEEMETLKPFGSGNPEPLLVSSDLQVTSIRNVGKKNEHIKLEVSNGEVEVECIGFKLAEKFTHLKKGDCIDLLFSPQINRWNGSENIQLVLSDVRSGKRAAWDPVVELQTGESREVAFAQELLEAVKKKEQFQCFSADAEEQLLQMLPFLKGNLINPIVLFPLQSMAADFRRRILEAMPDQKVCLIDCVTSNSEIRGSAALWAVGKIDVLVTSLGTWKAIHPLFRSTGPQNYFESSESLKQGEPFVPCMCIQMGHWGTMFPGKGVLAEVYEILSEWDNGALIAGSGKHLKTALESISDTRVIGGSSLPDPEILFCTTKDKVDAVCRICSQADKNLVFVNSSQEAIALSREMAKDCFKDSGEVRSYYGGLGERQKRLILEDFNFGTSKVLVSSRSLAPSNIVSPDSLVVHRFPINLFDYNRFLIAPKVYLTYTQEDYKRSQAYVRSLCPDDNILEYVGKNMRYCRKGGFGELHRKLSRGLQGRSRRALSVALTIFLESSLDYGSGEILAASKDSWRYKEALKEVEAFHAVAEMLGNIQYEAAAALEC